MSEDIESRVTSLEHWRNKVEGDLKADAVRQQWMDEKFKELGRQITTTNDSLGKRVDKIDGHISKLVWLILAALVTGVMGFIISGGLSGG